MRIEAVQLNRGRCEWQDDLKIVGKTYNFGDKVSIGTGMCNLLEYSIVVNGKNWTWRVNN